MTPSKRIYMAMGQLSEGVHSDRSDTGYKYLAPALRGLCCDEKVTFHLSAVCAPTREQLLHQLQITASFLHLDDGRRLFTDEEVQRIEVMVDEEDPQVAYVSLVVPSQV